MVGRALPAFLNLKTLIRWRNLWLAVVASAFLLGNFWLFVAFFILFTFLAFPKSSANRITYYLLLLCALPLLPVEIPMPGIRYLFELTYPRLLALCCLLLPFITGRTPMRIFTMPTDRWLILYIALISFSEFRDNTATNALRECFLYFLDIYLPYFMLSRFLPDLPHLNRALIAFAIGLLPTTFIAIFEAIKHWHLFNDLITVLTGKNPKFAYDNRGGALRATSVFKGPIILGYAMLIEFYVLLYLKPLIRNKKTFNLLMLAVIAGLLASVARGPWVAFTIAFATYLWTGPNSIKYLSTLAASAIGGLFLLSLTEAGRKFIDLLPIIGTARSDTIDYRAKLLEVSWVVFQQNPWFGSTTFLETPEMESMRQGQGIIDIVNSFVFIALNNGMIGLGLFLAIFAVLMSKCYWLSKHLPANETELIRLGRILLSILSGILLTIFTTSPIDYVPVLFWAFIGISAAYVNIAEKTLKELKKQSSQLKSNS
ncbi:hypothetical protein JCM14076_01850 [Methylosoma difficile]